MLKLEVDILSMDEHGKTAAYPERITIRERAEEITFRQYVDFGLALASYPLYIQDFFTSTDRPATVATWNEKQWAMLYEKLVEIISIFSDKDARMLFSLPLQSQDEKIKEEVRGNVHALVARILNGILGYQPQSRSKFQHKGHTYLLPASEVDYQGNTQPGAFLSVGEAIEALQAESVFSGVDEAGKLHFADKDYHIGLCVAAAMCRKVTGWKRVRRKGWKKILPSQKVAVTEKAPAEPEKWDSFFSARCQELEDLPANIALDVLFFLARSNPTLRRTLSSHMPFKLLLLAERA